MGDSPAGKKASIPQWQRQGSTEPAANPTPADDAQAQEAQPESRADLISQASKFLDDAGIQNASKERKTAFLQSKGLTREEIEALLEPASARDPSAESQTEAPSREPETPFPPQQTSFASNMSRDTPPIITYPEFLTHPSSNTSPPSLINSRNVVSTLYLVTGAFGAAYGASHYLVAPMVETLTDARHSLASTALSNISELNSRLERVVSEVPPSALHPRSSTHAAPYSDADSDALSTADSDPTELFHVDIGTQTSPHLSRRSSTASNTHNDKSTSDIKDAKLGEQESRLNIIQLHLAELVEDSHDVGLEDSSVLSSLNDLKDYLDGLVYSSPYAANASSYSSIIGGGAPATGSGGAGAGQNKPGARAGAAGAGEDVIGKVKGEIRGVKGVLLSARNFPGGGGVGKVRAH